MPFKKAGLLNKRSSFLSELTNDGLKILLGDLEV